MKKEKKIYNKILNANSKKRLPIVCLQFDVVVVVIVEF